MLRKTLSILLALGGAGTITLACTSSGTSSGDEPSKEDADDDDDDGTEATCDLSSLPKALTISEGGRLVLERKGAFADEKVKVTGSGVVLTPSDEAIAIRAPYVASAEAELSLKVGCGKGKAVTIPITLRPLTWRALAQWGGEDGPPAREYGTWWLDEGGDHSLFVFSGFHYQPKQFTPSNDAWRFDFATSTWSPLANAGMPLLPAGRSSAIPGERAVYYFGGSTATDGAIDTPPTLHRFDYDDAAVTATKVPATGAPGSYTGSFVYDARRSRWLSVCGLDVYGKSSDGTNCDVHSFTAATGFTKLAVAGTPPHGRYGYHYAFDAENDRVILFGGQIGSANSSLDGETWSLELANDAPTWVQLFAESPEAIKRRNGAYAYDPVGHRLFVFGGTANGKDAVPGIQALSLDRGQEAWATVDLPSEVVPRASALGIYDPNQSRLLFGFGNTSTLFRDLWSVDVANDAPK